MGFILQLYYYSIILEVLPRGGVVIAPDGEVVKIGGSIVKPMFDDGKPLRTRCMSKLK